MAIKKIAIIGSTGSVGIQTLNIVRKYAAEFEIVALTAFSNHHVLLQQCLEFKPKLAVIKNPPAPTGDWHKHIAHEDTRIHSGEMPYDFLEISQTNFLLFASPDIHDLPLLYHAIKNNIEIALANKEMMVAFGQIIKEWMSLYQPIIHPLDSEVAATQQCLQGRKPEEIKKIILTASGGPFRQSKKADFAKASIPEVLQHPVWKMGKHISVNSATLMNKGFELIETSRFFHLAPEMVDAIVHPQAIVHSIVEYTDNSLMAHLAYPDMALPIANALFYPQRALQPVPTLAWQQLSTLQFEPIDEEKFPAVKLSKQALKSGGNATTVLLAANTAAVEAFLQNKIHFGQITEVCEHCLDKILHTHEVNLEVLTENYKHTFTFAQTFINQLN